MSQRSKRRSVGGHEPAPGNGLRLEAEHADRNAAHMGVPHHGGLGAAPASPALERLGVRVGDGAHDRADVERLLALRVVLVGEDVADSAEVGSRGRRVRGLAHVSVSRVDGMPAPGEPLSGHDVRVLVVAEQDVARVPQTCGAQYCP